MATVASLSMDDLITLIPKLHAAWNKATGQQLPLLLASYEQEWAYREFVRAGYTESDIYFVVRYLRRKVHEGSRNPGALRWSNVMGSVERFAEEMELARAEARNTKPPPSPKAQVLQQARPVVVEQVSHESTARSSAELIANLKKAAGMI